MQPLCPLCRQTLKRELQRWSCPNQHSFDIAREGYTHLLPVQKKKSRAPGDDKRMVAARSRFLSGAYYQKFSDQLNTMVLELAKSRQLSSLAVIDAGCGEGYYSQRLQQYCQQHALEMTLAGIDISKFACRAAARREPENLWLVASSSDIPLASDSADILLCLFAPIQEKEFKRCLKADGLLIVASTGPAHLLELRQLLYQQLDQSTLQSDTVLQAEFSPIEEAQLAVQYPLELEGSDTIQDLLAMTPHFWRASPEKKQQLEKLQQLTVSVDIHLRAYKAN